MAAVARKQQQKLLRRMKNQKRNNNRVKIKTEISNAICTLISMALFCQGIRATTQQTEQTTH